MSVHPISIKEKLDQTTRVISNSTESPIQRASAEEHLEKVENKFDTDNFFLGKVRKKIYQILAIKILENLQRERIPAFSLQTSVLRTTPPTPDFIFQIGSVASKDTFQRELCLALCNYIANSEKFKMMQSTQLNDEQANILGSELGLAIYRKLASLQENCPKLLKASIYNYMVNENKVADNFFSRYLVNKKMLIEPSLLSPTASLNPSPKTINSQQFLFKLANTNLHNSAYDQGHNQHFTQTSPSQSENSYTAPSKVEVQETTLKKKSWFSCFS